MTPTERILAYWKSITPAADVAQHEDGMRDVIEEATRTETADFIEPISFIWRGERLTDSTEHPQFDVDVIHRAPLTCGDERVDDE